MKITEDFKFNKKFGQNFISDKNLLNAIVKDSGVSLNDEVLEIGTGAGTLTTAIASRVKRVVTYEIDKKLTEFLQEKFKDISNIQLIMADCLKQDIKNIEANFEGEYFIIANLPYYITTPLIFKFLEETSKAKVITIMVQKEVAQKIISKTNNNNYGILSVMLQYYCDVKITRIVKKQMFTPSPKVDSAIVRLERKKGVTYNEKFSKFVAGCFGMKRKTLVNNLTKIGFDKEKILTIFNTLKLEPNIRAESLDYKILQQIFTQLDN